ncbi:MAG TPA: hypothetical protein VHJ34_13975 [Actinomycetota bacterium]|nr:hypothetical protein [Actinomycetota bacterium]
MNEIVAVEAPTQYLMTGGGYVAVNVYVGYPIIYDIYVEHPEFAALAVSSEVTLPADAEVDRATFSVTAEAAGLTVASSVADVRAAEPPSDGDAAITLDFGRLVTISGVGTGAIDAEVVGVYRWDGTRFTGVASADGPFVETATDRLLIEFDASVDVDDARDALSVTLPAQPAGLELAVDGTTVWYERQGASAGLAPPETTGVGYAIERTAELRDALARAAGGPVRVELRASAPARLALARSIEHHRVHAVAFPEGPDRSVDVAEEGPFDVELPLPPEATGWRVDEVRLTVRGTPGDDRVVPAEGPDTVDDVHVVLAAGRTVLARVPASLVSQLDEVVAVRVPLRAPGDGGEVTGRLLPDDGGRPGEPAPGGELAPLAVDAGAAAAYRTLVAAEPVAAGPLWLELTMTYGETEWLVTANAENHATAPGATLHRRLPGGGLRPFPTLEGLGPRFGALRLVGRAPANRPIAALALDVDTGAPAEVTPSRTGVAAIVGLETPLRPATPSLPLRGVARALGGLTFADVRVIYRETE